MFEQEEYRQIEGYDNYSVSNLGNVRNDKTGRILQGCLHKLGYLHINLYKEGKKKMYKIHRLVSIAFLPNPNNLPEVDHINRLPYDNRLENLRWISIGNNERNKKKREGLTSKYIGIHWHKQHNKWGASLSLNGKRIHLGYFKTEEEAYEAWCNAVRENNLQEFYGL
jgi:hypothetical protein